MASSLHPTPEWANEYLNRVIPDDNPQRLDALLHMLADIAPSEQESAGKYEAAWMIIECGYHKTPYCSEACRERYLAAS